MHSPSHPPPPESLPDPDQVPADASLYVDLEGTLISTNLAWEGFFSLLRDRPRAALSVPIRALRGRAWMSSRIADHVSPDVETLPYVPEVVADLKKEREQGRSLILVTASDARWARAVADHLGLFDRVLAVDRSARRAGETLPRPEVGGGPMGPLFHLLRPHQWAKNLLLFVPVVTAHRLAEVRVLFDVVLASLAFCSMASAVYIFNDLLDLGADRRHPSKRRRPLASGRVPIPKAIVMALGLVLLAGLVGLPLPRSFLCHLFLYAVLTTAYSIVLKRKLMVDVLCLAGLYTLRISSGGAATSIPISPWLQTFSIFFFLSLAFLKRQTELLEKSDDPAFEKIGGRGYMPVDLPMIRVLGPTSGYLAILVFSLYLSGPDVAKLYPHPGLLWFLCPVLLYWISRAWFLGQRRQLLDDPVLFALKDRVSYLAGLVVVVVLALASYPGRYPFR